MDLFKAVIPEDKLHPNFSNILKYLAQSQRDVIDDWAKGFVDRDGKFTKEFQSTFNSSFWELYLFATLKECGCRVDFSFNAPDFIVEAPEKFAIEATTANAPIEAEREWDRSAKHLESVDINEVLRIATIRLSNSIHAKHKMYLESYSKLPHMKNRPFVVAIAPFEQPRFNIQNLQAINRVLFGWDGGEWVDETTADLREMTQIEKTNGAKIDFAVFQEGKMPEISAVIFSSTATWGKVTAVADAEGLENVTFLTQRFNEGGQEPIIEELPKAEYKEHLLDGLSVFHNPSAVKPLSRKVFQNSIMSQIWLENGGLGGTCPNRFLHQRNVIRKVSRKPN